MAKPTKSDLLASLDDFTSAYVACALWSSTDNADDTGGEPLDRNYSESDITRAALLEMIRECRDFRDLCEKNPVTYTTLDGAKTTANPLAGISEGSAGHDFWLTRNGHGAGFWDRGYPREVSDALCTWARSFGTCDLYVYQGKIRIS